LKTKLRSGKLWSMNKIWTGLTLLALFLVSGCDKPSGGSVGAPGVAVQPGEPTHAQPRLQTIKLWLGAEEMITELAVTAEQVQTGMMYRTNMEENSGMLFIFARPDRRAFWMKHTLVPLSAAYIDPDGRILEIHPLEPGNTNSVVGSSDRIQYVLETPQGWFQRHNVREGAVIRTERGPLRETFFRQR
jgi:uncharacterized protein